MVMQNHMSFMTPSVSLLIARTVWSVFVIEWKRLMQDIDLVGVISLNTCSFRVLFSSLSLP